MNSEFSIPNSELTEVAKILQKDGVAIIPTDTVYGLAGKSARAKKKICEIKKRPAHKPIPILISSLEQLEKFEVIINETARQLIKRFWPGALTIIFLKKDGKKIGIRMPALEFTRNLISLTGPLFATSANSSGKSSPVSFLEIDEEIKSKVDILVDKGKCPGARESTVVDVSKNKIEILRKGAVEIDK